MCLRKLLEQPCGHFGSRAPPKKKQEAQSASAVCEIRKRNERVRSHFTSSRLCEMIHLSSLVVMHDNRTNRMASAGDKSFKFLFYLLPTVECWPTVAMTGNGESSFDSRDEAVDILGHVPCQKKSKNLKMQARLRNSVHGH